MTLLAIALGRAVWLQAVRGPELAAMALRQHRETVVVPAGRGTIFDRNGEPLAIGRQATTVLRIHARSTTRATHTRDREAARTPTGRRVFVAVDRSRGFVYVERKADPLKAEGSRNSGSRASASTPRSCGLPAGSRRRSGARLRGPRQQRARRPRALARGTLAGGREARPSSRTRSAGHSTSSPRSRRRQARTSGSRSTSRSRRRRKRCSRTPSAAGVPAPPLRSSSTPTPDPSSRWRWHPGSTRTASRRPARIGAGIARSPTPTSRARRSSW